ncbi:MAG: hypothetical protein U9N85_01210 [Bacteroidota bacterium]|nr:hypothetical protein [Bacteroidota bacterium]
MQYRNIITDEVVTVTSQDVETVSYQKTKPVIIGKAVLYDFVKPRYVFEQIYKLLNK